MINGIQVWGGRAGFVARNPPESQPASCAPGARSSPPPANAAARPPTSEMLPLLPSTSSFSEKVFCSETVGKPFSPHPGVRFPPIFLFLASAAKIETCAGWAADAITCASELVQHPLVLKCCCAMCYSVLFYFHLLLRCKGLQCCIIFIIKDFLTFFVSRANPSLYQNYSNDCIISCGSVLLCSSNRFLPS